MPTIVIQNWAGKRIEATDLTKPLLRILQEHYLDWMHACGGKGRCTTCKAIVCQGMENIVPLTPAEKRYREAGALKENERLCCQVRINGDVIIAVPEESKFPHIDYEKA